MEPTSLIIMSVAMSVLVARGVTYSTGAPPEGCWSDRPLHGDNLPQGGHVLPYKIVVSANKYGPRDTVTVSIVGSDEASLVSHKGFLLRMVSSASQRGGLWAVDRQVHRYNPECGVTHRDSRTKTNTTILWRAPPEHKGHLGNIQFRAVVAANFTHFWDNIVSEALVPDYPDRGDTGMMRRFQQIFSILNDNKSPKQPKTPSGRREATNTNSTSPSQ